MLDNDTTSKQSDDLETDVREKSLDSREVPPSAEASRSGSADLQDVELNNLDREMNDEGNSARFAKRYKGKVRWVLEWKKWIVFRDGAWIPDEGDVFVRQYSRQIVADIRAEAQSDLANQKALLNWATKTLQATGLQRMLAGAKSFTGMSASAAELDRHKNLINFSNGTLDIATMNFRNHRPADLLTTKLDYPFDASQECPETISLLNVIFGIGERASTETDAGQLLLDYFQRCLGYSLSGANNQKIFFFLYGPANAGKSFILSLISTLAGVYHRHLPSEALMGRPTSGNTPQLATIRGARVITTSETEANQSWCRSHIKGITGGDELTTTAKFQAPVTFQPMCALWLCGNQRPRTSGDDAAFWSRMHVLPFISSIPIEKRKPCDVLRAIILKERSGIMNWALEGLQQVRRSGLVPPSGVLAATQEYQGACDIIPQFMAECCCTTHDLRIEKFRVEGDLGSAELVVSHKDLYAAYQAWCEDSGFSPLNKNNLANRMRDLGYVNSEYHPNNTTHWAGITLIDDCRLKENGMKGGGGERRGPAAYSRSNGWTKIKLKTGGAQ